MSGGIYLIINIINDMIYVGQAVHFYKRFAQHRYELANNEHGNSYLQNAYNKYNKQSFIYFILEHINDISKLDERETYWVNYFKSSDRNIGYNLRLDCKSNRGYRFSLEIRKRMGEGRKGKKRKPFTDITKKKMSEAQKLNKPSEYQLNRIRTMNIGRKHSKETITKRIEAIKKAKENKINEVIDNNLDLTFAHEIKIER